MNEDVSAILARIEGKLETLQVKVDAGDRNAAQLVELLKERVTSLVQQLADIKDVLATQRAEFIAGQSELRQTAASELSAVRVSLEDQLDKHATGEARPHQDLIADVEGLKTFRTQAKVVIGIVGLFAAPGAALILERLTQ